MKNYILFSFFLISSLNFACQEKNEFLSSEIPTLYVENCFPKSGEKEITEAAKRILPRKVVKTYIIRKDTNNYLSEIYVQVKEDSILGYGFEFWQILDFEREEMGLLHLSPDSTLFLFDFDFDGKKELVYFSNINETDQWSKALIIWTKNKQDSFACMPPVYDFNDFVSIRQDTVKKQTHVLGVRGGCCEMFMRIFTNLIFYSSGGGLQIKKFRFMVPYDFHKSVFSDKFESKKTIEIRQNEAKLFSTPSDTSFFATIALDGKYLCLDSVVDKNGEKWYNVLILKGTNQYKEARLKYNFTVGACCSNEGGIIDNYLIWIK